MSHALTLARPYARAAFALARDHGRLPQWSALIGIAATIASDEQMRGLLTHPQLGTDELVNLLLPNGEVDPNFRQFLTVLAENRRLSLLPEIAGLFEQLRADEEKVLRVKVTSAVELANSELERIISALHHRFGRRVEVQSAVDPELIGGAVIDTGEVVIDGSVRGKLRRLEASLAQ